MQIIPLNLNSVLLLLHNSKLPPHPPPPPPLDWQFYSAHIEVYICIQTPNNVPVAFDVDRCIINGGLFLKDQAQHMCDLKPYFKLHFQAQEQIFGWS